MGTIGILNVGAGDTKLVFDKNNPAECIRAARIVKDMLRRGYALLVDAGKGKYRRVLDFDATKYEYIIADFDPIEAEKADEQEREHAKIEQGAAKAGTASPAAQPKKRGRPPVTRRSISATSANGVAVARTAGG